VPETDVQALLDGAAAELQAGLSLDDVELRLINHTAHDFVDDVRQHAFVHRRLPAEVADWFTQWDLRNAAGPLRTPRDDALGLLERWCIPVRFRGTLLGYVWVLDAGRLEESQLDPALEAASQIGAVLFRKRREAQADTELLRLLLTPNTEDEQLAAIARSIGSYTHTGPVAVVAVGPQSVEAETPAVTSDLATAVRRTAEQEPAGTVLAGEITGLPILLAPLRERTDLTPAHRLAERILQLAAHNTAEIQAVAAIGGVAPTIDWATRSYVEARRTLRIMRAVPELGEIAFWKELGVFRALSLLPIGDRESEILDDRVRQLLMDETLAKTAETFLDRACDVQETAAELFIHRMTLYQRLDRITTVYGMDLRRNGNDRLVAHLGFKLARIVPRDVQMTPSVV
jgi:hypothetical protein